jgi:hypothetical protein
LVLSSGKQNIQRHILHKISHHTQTKDSTQSYTNNIGYNKGHNTNNKGKKRMEGQMVRNKLGREGK